MSGNSTSVLSTAPSRVSLGMGSVENTVSSALPDEDEWFEVDATSNGKENEESTKRPRNARTTSNNKQPQTAKHTLGSFLGHSRKRFVLLIAKRVQDTT